MTDGQIKYWTLMENARHNKEMEDIERYRTKLSERDVGVKESLLPYQQANLFSQSNLNEAKTSLTDYEKAEKVSQTARNWTGIWDSIVEGVTKPFKDARDTVVKLFF